MYNFAQIIFEILTSSESGFLNQKPRLGAPKIGKKGHYEAKISKKSGFFGLS